MKKNYSLVIIAILFAFVSGYGQCLTDNFNSGYGNWTGGSGTYQGAAAGQTGNGTGFNTTNDDIITTNTITNPQTMTLWLARSSSTANKTFSIEYSTTNSGPWTSARDILVTEVTTTHQEFTINLNLAGDYFLRLVMSQRSGGSYYLDDVEVNCSASCTDEVDFANIQAPTTTQTIIVGGNFDVFSRAYDPLYTLLPGANANVEAWIGYNTTNNNPNTSGWTWIPATFNVQVGNDDEYQAEIGSGLAPNTYYYASRYRLNSCGFTYGGTGGNWNNDSVQLIVEADQVDFCNVDFPKTATIPQGSTHNVYAQAYEPGVTDAAGQGANILAWIGYNTVGINHQPWNASGWTWVAASYDSDSGNNDQYVADIGSGRTAGTYYYASRFQLNGSDYSYGGIQSDNIGNFWNATNNNGTLIVESPPNNVTGIIGCFNDTTVDLTWNAPATGTTPDGYVVFIRTGATDPNAVAGTNASAYNGFNTDFSVAPTASVNLGKYVYKGTGTNTTITGLTEGTNYSITVYAYSGEAPTGWAAGATNGSTVTNALAQGDVRNFIATPVTNQVTLNWLNPLPTSCWDDILIVANQGAVAFTPSGNGSAYTANAVYSGANQVVYKGSGNSVAVTGLTNNLNYCFRAYIRRGTTWTQGVEVCATPTLTYCDSYGDGGDGFLSLIRNVEFNTINNPSPNTDNDYTDFTSISTNVNIGESHNLTVNVNTDYNISFQYTTTTMAWIDWNQDGDFNDFGEDYSLGNAYDVENGATDNSPLSIDVPTNAAIGSTRMRISTRYGTIPSTPCQQNFDGEVEDYTIVVQQPTGPEINIKGNNISIPSGFNAPYGLNNTLYGTINLGSSSASKTFTIKNIGLANLDLSGAPIVDIIGLNPGDFTVNVQPSVTMLTSNAEVDFEITFTPLADGERNATVSISNNDVTGSENPYLFDIKGTGQCAAAVTSSIWPTEGPVGTEITVTSSSNLTGATASLNSIALTILSTTTSELILQLPNGVTDGNLVVTLTTGCSSTNSFDVIDTSINGCDSGTSSTTPSDIFISEVTDATSGSSSYVEIFNGTGVAVNLTDYDLIIYNNGNATSSGTVNLSGTLANNATHVVSIGTTSCSINNLSVTPNQSNSSLGGINFDNNKADAIVLAKTSGSNPGEKDAFGLKGSGTWANGLSFGSDGVNFRRKNDAPILPTMAFDLTHWDIIDWTSCSDSDYVNIGVYDFSLGIPPTITLQPIDPISTCNLTATLTVAATEGVASGLALAYQWYYLAPMQTTWTAVTNNVTYAGATNTTLDILNTLNTIDYQFYCQVRENGATCYSASEAVKLKTQKAEWNGSIWLNGITPDIYTVTVINGDYNTTTASFSACQLVINATHKLTIADNTFVEVENNTIVNGDLTVETHGAFVQNVDLANGFTLNSGGNALVNKTTSFINNWYDYTYWSSPIVDETVGDALDIAPANRRFWFDATRFEDVLLDNSNNTLAGSDDIDDTGDDWQVAPAGSIMQPGVGYAATVLPIGFTPRAYQAIFEGAFNNAVIQVPIYYNGANGDNDWNFIGNPYPSAIDFDAVHALNSSLIDGAAYLWSHASPPLSGNDGNQVLNFNKDDYAIITIGSGNTAGGDGIAPNMENMIGSGQGFFVKGLATGNLTFNNRMRRADVTSNSQFFRNSSRNSNANRLWLDLRSDNGIYNQMLVAYVDGATTGFDGFSYDAQRNLSSGNAAVIYTEIPGDDRKFAIQGKDPNDLDIDEIIPFGFKTTINTPTLYTFSLANFEGEFLTNNTIYLHDKFMNIFHDLNAINYSFTSETGEFNDRFEIVFRPQPLSIDANEYHNALTIIEQQDGSVKFSISNSLQIKNVKIYDVLGRLLYNLKGTSSTEIYHLDTLSQAAYVAKVTLSNEVVVTKKAIKRN